MSFLGLSGPFYQPLAEAGVALGLGHGVALEPDYISPWWASAHGHVMAFQCGVDELGVTGHAAFQDPRVSAYERDLREGPGVGSCALAIGEDGRLLQQASATGVSLAGLEIARPTEGKVTNSIRDHGDGCTDEAWVAAKVAVQKRSSMHRRAHPLPMRITFEGDVTCQDNLRRRKLACLQVAFHQGLLDVLHAPTPCRREVGTLSEPTAGMLHFHHAVADGPFSAPRPLMSGSLGVEALMPLPLPVAVAQTLHQTSPRAASWPLLHPRVRLAPGACTARLPLASDHSQEWGYHVVPSDPPALLGKIGPPRPSHISKLGLARVDILPAHLSQYPVVEIPVDQLGLFALDPGKRKQIMRFSVFDQDRHHVHRTASQEWSLGDLVSEAIRSYGEPVRSAQVLEQYMPGLATPQIVLTPQSSRPNELCVPVDMRPFGGRPCTLLLQAGAQAADVIRAALHTCPQGPIFLPPSHDGRDIHLLDARGQVWHELPHDLSQLQWLRISGPGPLEVMAMEEDFTAPSAFPPMGTTTATSTWVGHSVVEHVSFVLTGMGITMRLHPQHVSQVRIADSIADLVMALARQRAMPPRARLVLTAGQPHPLTRRHVTILLLLYPDDHRRHVVLDPSSDGSMAQSISVDARTCPEELVAAVQAREGYVAMVNGCPQAASRRVLYNGTTPRSCVCPPSIVLRRLTGSTSCSLSSAGWLSPSSFRALKGQPSTRLSPWCRLLFGTLSYATCGTVSRSVLNLWASRPLTHRRSLCTEQHMRPRCFTYLGAYARS